MIITKIYSGLGNQMYQYAIGRYLAHKHNTILKLDISQCELDKFSKLSYYRLGEFNIQENFATQDEIDSLTHIRNDDFLGFSPDILNLQDNVYLDGGWGNENYFKGIADILKREFTLKNPLGKNSAVWKDKILTADCAVSLHIRLGDYMSTLWRCTQRGILSLDYYLNCIRTLKNFVNNFTVFVFSDDIEMAKKIFHFDFRTEFVEGCETAAEEMHLMSLCKHNIMANSTFSWWGAWLNQNPNKKVLACPWYANTQGSWIGMPALKTLNPSYAFNPLMTMIIYIDNDMPNASLAISTVLNQQLPDCEIIIIDSSIDGSGNNCRDFAKNENVTFMKTNYDTNKFKAWNIGLNVARGGYVMFMTGKDFIFPPTSSILLQTVSTASNLNDDNWDKDSVNIICSIQRIEENPNGDIKIGGIENKRFTNIIDERFKDLKAVSEINLDNRDKFIMLSTQQINDLVSTKIFKRRFLNEHNIRFDTTKMGGGTELKFLVESFMHTDTLLFIPNIIYGRLN